MISITYSLFPCKHAVNSCKHKCYKKNPMLQPFVNKKMACRPHKHWGLPWLLTMLRCYGFFYPFPKSTLPANAVMPGDVSYCLAEFTNEESCYDA